jgi:hypothetical protein
MAEKGDVEAYVDVNYLQNEITKIETTKNGTIKDKSLRVLSKMRSSNWKDPGPPPDGGALAWAQVLAGHLIVLNTW